MKYPYTFEKVKEMHETTSHKRGDGQEMDRSWLKFEQRKLMDIKAPPVLEAVSRCLPYVSQDP